MSARPKIDEIDVRILKTLLKDARASFTEIAKDCEMSTNAIRMRFKRLKKAGVITGSTVHVKPKSLGYQGIVYLAIEADVNEEQSVLKFLDKIPNIILSHAQIGKHNIVSYLVMKNIDDLVRTLDLVRSNPHIRMADSAISVNTSQFYHPENLVIEPFHGLSPTNELLPSDSAHKLKTVSPNFASESTEENYFNPSLALDEIDQRIIRLLSKNARISFRKIAKKLGISTKNVIGRFKKLEKEVIPYSTITLNLKKIGYICNAVFCINVSHPHNINDVIDEIIRIPNIISATRCVDGIDVLAIAPFANFEQLFKLKQEIAKISGIKQLEILLEKTYSNWPQNVFSTLL